MVATVSLIASTPLAKCPRDAPGSFGRASRLRYHRRSPLRERDSMADAADTKFAALIHTHRGYLLRVAALQLRDADLAEDVVQETLLAALHGAQGFSGRSSIKTWLTGILKHKIVDAIRKKGREPAVVVARRGVPDRRLRRIVRRVRPLGQSAGRLGRSRGATVAPAVLRRHGLLPGKAAAEHGPRVHDARGDGARGRRDL